MTGQQLRLAPTATTPTTHAQRVAARGPGHVLDLELEQQQLAVAAQLAPLELPAPCRGTSPGWLLELLGSLAAASAALEEHLDGVGAELRTAAALTPSRRRRAAAHARARLLSRDPRDVSTLPGHAPAPLVDLALELLEAAADGTRRWAEPLADADAGGETAAELVALAAQLTRARWLLTGADALVKLLELPELEQQRELERLGEQAAQDQQQGALTAALTRQLDRLGLSPATAGPEQPPRQVELLELDGQLEQLDDAAREQLAAELAELSGQDVGRLALELDQLR